MPERVDQSQDLQIICNAKIVARLIGRDVTGIDADDDFCLVLQLLQKFDLCILIKSRKNSHSVLIVNQLTAEFQIQPFCISPVNPFQNKLRLLFYVFLCVKTFFQHDSSHCNLILTA